jgi:hypothetical protein
MMKMTPAKDKENFEASARKSYAQRPAGQTLDTDPVEKGREILKLTPLREGPMQSQFQKVETRLTTMAQASKAKRETFHLILLRENGKVIGPTLHASGKQGLLKQMVPIARGLKYWNSTTKR